MNYIDNSDDYFNIIAPVIKAFGYDIVEIAAKVLHDGLHIHIVLYSSGGISISDCSKVHRTVQRRIEAYTENRDFFIEVSSPGITRIFKTANEFTVFTGNYVKLLLEDNTDWIRYKIIKADNLTAELLPVEQDNTEEIESVIIPYNRIRKAKLDY